MKKLIVAVTGAAGQVARYLLPYIASGQTYGKECRITLKLLDLSSKQNLLKSIQMELEDCCFPLLDDVITTDNPNIAFKDANQAVLIGASPRGKGMKRVDLLKKNASIFREHGKIINDFADRDVKVTVVGNPANTNCLIVMKNAPKIPKSNFRALTHLDQNRAYSLLANNAKVNVSDINGIIIWGNHGESKFPDLEHAFIKGIPAKEYLNNSEWIYNEYVKSVRKRGSDIINYKGASSGLSAAKAIVDNIKSFETKSHNESWFCSAVKSDGSYGIDEDIVFSFPIKSHGYGKYHIVDDLYMSEDTKKHILDSLKDLIKERDMVKEFLL